MTQDIAFIAGATGYTGREVARQLAAAGVRTVAHVRPDSTRLQHWTTLFAEQGVEVDSTPWQVEAMGKTLAALQPTLVFALLGTTRARARALERAGGDASAASYEAVDHDLTVLLLEAAEACGNRPRFAYLSSIGAGPNASSSYLKVRARVEERVSASNLPWTNCRPALISGADRDDERTGERIGATLVDAALGLVGALGGAALRRRWASHGNVDLAAGLIRCARDPAWRGRVAEAKDLREPDVGA